MSVARAVMYSMACLAVFFLDALVIQLPRADHYDLRLHDRYMSLVGPTGHRVLAAFTLSGAGHQDTLRFAVAVVAVVTAVCGWLVRRRQIRTAAMLGVLVLGSFCLDVLFKSLIPRPGPVIDNGNIGLRTFPSGHTVVGVTLFLAAAHLIGRSMPTSARRLWMLVGTSLSFLIVLSALTFHFPSEVFGGLMLSGAWLFLALPLSDRFTAADPTSGSPGLRYVDIPTKPVRAASSPTQSHSEGPRQTPSGLNA